MLKRTVILFILFIRFLLPQNQSTTTFHSVYDCINEFSNLDPFRRGDAVKAAVKYGEKGIKELSVSLTSPDANTRECSAIVLSKIAPAGGSELLNIIIKGAYDSNSVVRWNCALAIGKFGHKAADAVPRLLILLNDEDSDVRWAAAKTLRDIAPQSLALSPSVNTVSAIADSLIPVLQSRYKVPGVSICLIKDSKIAWSNHYGYADASAKTPVTNKTIFEACSMSKPVFAFLVLKLVQHGKLKLDEPLYKYYQGIFTSFDTSYPKQITARMLLSHTAGTPNWRKGDDETDGPIPIYFKPGTRFLYSGEGIFYLQKVIESITKQPLEIISKNELFDKLGFTSTSFVWNDNIAPYTATGHDTSGNIKTKSHYTHANAAYTLYTTAEEYAKFIIELMQPPNPDNVSVTNQLITEMLKHQVRVDTRDVTDRPGRALGLYSFRGLGWGIDSTITGDIVYHSGANLTGFRCYSQFNMNTRTGIVIMTNSLNGTELWTRLISKIGDY